MEVRRRVALASAAALVGALSTGFTLTVASASEPSAGVTFSSQSAVAPLVAHYTVSPTERPEDTSGSSGGDNRQLPRLNKHSQGPAKRSSTSNVSAAPLSDNTIADSTTSSPSSPSRLATPSNAAGDGTKASASFIGQQSSATTCSYFLVGCNPPDMAVAASTQFVFQGVNTQFEVLDTSGHVQPGWPVSAQAFFGVKNVRNQDGPCDIAFNSQPFLSDPRALYDPVDHRFWAAMLQIEGINNVAGLSIATDCPFKSVYYIAVSQSNDPGGSWNVYEFNMSLDGQFFSDFTQIGLNRDAVYFSANMFGPRAGLNGGFYAEVFEANKSTMERGRGGFTADGFFNLQAQGPSAASVGPFVADTVQPALNLDGSGGRGEVFIDTLDGPDPVTGNFCGFFGAGVTDTCSGLALWRMTNPIGHDSGGGAPSLTAAYVPTKPFVSTPAFSEPADQPSCDMCIDGSDLRISATPVVRGGQLYAAWETLLNNGTQFVPGIEWAQIRLANGGAQDFADTSRYYNFSGDTAATYPALMPEPNGDLLMVFDSSSRTVFPQTRYVIRKGGHGNFNGKGVLLKAGESSYRPDLCGTIPPPPPPPLPPPGPVICRWGDYSAASFDGANGIWFAGEYANEFNPNPPQFGRNWGTWIGAVNASGGGD
jgi:hypothetical protein